MTSRRFPSGFVLVVLALSLSAGFADERSVPLRVGGLTARPGEAVSGYVEVPPRGDEGTVIPVTVINGARPGPILACVAAVHGYEYPPVLALYELKAALDPATLSGALILVHIANVPSFARRTIYYTPADWKNLNRVFPGDAAGTLSQRIARVLTEEVVDRCDALLDLHGGDGNEALIPYSYWMVGRDPKVNETSRSMALAFGLKHIIIDRTRTQDPADSKYLGNTAVLRGKPAVTTETGALGLTDEAYVRMARQGIESVMRLLGILPGRPAFVPEPVWIDAYEVLNSGSTGLFRPLVRMGEAVLGGQKVGEVLDYLGNAVEEVRAPYDGIVLYIIGTPPISRGEPVVEIGRLKR